MPEDQKKTYIGVKRIEAYPEDRDGKPGYAVIYPDGYKSWSPKDVFEAAYFPIKKANSLTQNDIDRMIDASEVNVQTIGEKTTMLRVVLPTGFELVEASACVNPEIRPLGHAQDLRWWKPPPASILRTTPSRSAPRSAWKKSKTACGT